MENSLAHPGEGHTKQLFSWECAVAVGLLDITKRKTIFLEWLVFGIEALFEPSATMLTHVERIVWKDLLCILQIHHCYDNSDDKIEDVPEVILLHIPQPDCYLRQGAHPAWQGAGGMKFTRNGSRTCFLR